MTRKLTNLPLLCKLFKGIPAEEVEPLINRLGAGIKTLPKGKVLFGVGTKADRFAIVLSGALSVSTYDVNGHRNIVEQVDPMGTVAVALAVAGVERLRVTVEAKVETEVLLFDVSRVLCPDRILDAVHVRFIRNLTVNLAEKAVMLGRKISILSHRTTAKRLMTYLHGQSIRNNSLKFEIPFDRQALADFLCVERSALSAEIGRLCKEGVISVRKNHFELLKDVDDD
jgi:CRP-like cAMP-binding protein